MKRIYIKALANGSINLNTDQLFFTENEAAEFIIDFSAAPAVRGYHKWADFLMDDDSYATLPLLGNPETGQILTIPATSGLMIPGVLRVQIYATKGEIKTVWSEARIYIKPVLNNTEIPVTEHPDLILQLFERMEDVEAAGITIGEVVTLPHGSQAYVNNVGSPQEAILNIGLPSGSEGPVGPIGLTGEPGDSGVYLGDVEPATEVNVWIKPNGTTTNIVYAETNFNKIWVGTQAEFDLLTPDANTIYLTTEV